VESRNSPSRAAPRMRRSLMLPDNSSCRVSSIAISHIAVDGKRQRGQRLLFSSMANIAEVIDSDDIDILSRPRRRRHRR